MEEFDFIIGIHSIISSLQNPNRSVYKLVGTEDAIEEISKAIKVPKEKILLCSTHKVQEEAKNYFRLLKLDYHRVPSGVFLICSPLELKDVTFLYKELENKEGLKILCLDQLTDVHNAGAIIRTASFYGIDIVVVPDKKSFGMTPSFFRIASGATEYINIVGVSKLTKTISKLKDNGVLCMALSEHAKGNLDQDLMNNHPRGLCLVLGREDVGISNAVLRLIDYHVSLESQGSIKSLNVSAAAAISMEKCFGKK